MDDNSVQIGTTMNHECENLKEVMRRWASGVAVVTSVCGSAKAGTTISSLASLSLDPPLILINLASENPTQTMIQEAGFFGITLLGNDQKAISDLFAGYNKTIKDRFDGLKTFTLESGAPLIEGGIAYLDCRLYHCCEMPKSRVLVGEVIAGQLGEVDKPLVFLNRGYVNLLNSDAHSG
jgi:3-hydroxy-9,10-secoandrosta-1,3,5(10)-triene-9,17-dione monooxygenase reductase component